MDWCRCVVEWVDAMVACEWVAATESSRHFRLNGLSPHNRHGFFPPLFPQFSSLQAFSSFKHKVLIPLLNPEYSKFCIL
jgi:hypothetical protein